MERTMKNLSLATIIFIAFGCAPDVVLDKTDAYITINGHYDVETLEVENTCSGVEDPLDRAIEMRVIVQEELEDGGYIADLSIGGLAWLDAEIAPDGTYEAVFNWLGIEIDTFSGTIGPNDDGDVLIQGTIFIDIVDHCNVLYMLNGYQIYTPNPPPENSL